LMISYGGAALASQSVQSYFSTARSLREYVRKVDSFLNPGRQPVLSLFGDFFVHAIPGGRIAELISALALVAIIISFVRRTTRVWLLLAMFLPFNIFGWFMLDTNSISRYAVSYAAMYAILAADALALLPLIQTIVVAFIVVRLMWWAIPALRDVRT